MSSAVEFRVEVRSQGRFATPILIDWIVGRNEGGLHVRRERLGFVPRSGTNFCRPVPNLSVMIRNFFTAV